MGVRDAQHLPGLSMGLGWPVLARVSFGLVSAGSTCRSDRPVYFLNASLTFSPACLRSPFIWSALPSA